MTQGHDLSTANLLVMVAAGGTGGHLFPAESLSAALAKRGIATALATDNRAAKYSEHFKSMYVVPSETFRGRDPISIARDRPNPPIDMSRRGRTGMIRPNPIASIKIVAQTKMTVWRLAEGIAGALHILCSAGSRSPALEQWAGRKGWPSPHPPAMRGHRRGLGHRGSGKP